MSETTTTPEEAQDDSVVDAAAERALFVDMLTRDIEHIPAIIDLIDNSIDGARALSSEGLEDYWVDVTAGPDSFIVTDNCGGIELDVARHYAFRFGRPEEYQGTKGSVGQFGVGMKRALFKLGNHFVVDSRAESTSFLLEVPVTEWADDPDPIWRFTMARTSRNYNSDEGGRGTKITITKLHDSIADDLQDDQFLSLLREQIRYRHQAALGDGLKVTLNGSRLTGFQRELLSGASFEPVNRTFVVSSEAGDVSVRVVAGIVESERREIGQDDGDAENFRRVGDAGWWIFCNDRLLIMRDRSRLTGWGDNVPVYHPQYRQFRGYVWMSAAETAALPWNTTKTGVDENSPVWRQVQAQIKVTASQVVSIINRLKTEAQTAPDENAMPTVIARRRATMTPVRRLPERSAFVAPPIPPAPKKPRAKKARVQHLQYDVPLDRFNEVADHVGTDVIAEVGRRTFDYYYDREIAD